MAKFALTWALLLSAVCGEEFVQTFRSENFTAPNMKIARSGHTDAGYLFFGTVESDQGEQAPYIMTDDNELIWKGPHSAPHNFRVQSYQGKDVLTYFTGVEDKFGHGYGKVIIVDDSYKVVHTVCIKDSPHHHFVTPDPSKKPGNDPNFCFVDYHESYITDRGSVLVTAFNVTQADLRHFGGPRDGWIFDWLFYEVDIASEKILFKWSALDHIDITKSNYYNQEDGSLDFDKKNFGTSQSEPWDFFHGNSVSPMPGGHYLINSRMTWSCYKIDGKTGKVVWTLEGSNGGDFMLEDSVPFFSWQHMPRLAEHGHSDSNFHIHLFNNDNIRNIGERKTNVSSGYLLKVDTNDMHVEAVRKLQSLADPIYAVAQGSYQSLNNGHVLLGYGAQPFIDEYDGDDNLIYRAQFASTKGRVAHSYRAFKQKWHGHPKSRPKVAGVGKHVYASWNGATDYDGWKFYAGKSKGNLRLVASHVVRKGFETKHPLPKGHRKFKYVMAEATLKGRVLAKSKVQRVT